jgi:hypothetical protein
MEGPLNARQELGGLREWLWQLRSEIDAGLGRVDQVIKKMKGDGSSQIKKKKKFWTPKPKPKPNKKFSPKDNRLDLTGANVAAGAGPMAHLDGAGPSAGHQLVISKPIAIPEGARSSVGRGSLEGTSFKPIAHVQLGGDKVTNVGDLGSMEGPHPSGGGGPSSSGNDDINSVVAEPIPAAVRTWEGNRREAGCVQTSPIGGPANSEPQRMPPAASVSGYGVTRGDRGLVSRPECSWVAGRTGFGPVHTGEIVGSTDLGDISAREETIYARVVSVHNKIDPIVDSGDETTLGGEEKSVQVCSLETTDALEVYCRRDTPAKRNSKLRNRDSGDSTEGDLAESSLQGGVYVQEVGQSSVDNTFVECSLEKSMEVSDVAGLSWDDQEGRKEEYLRRIVAAKTESGRDGDTNTNISDFQQAANSMGRFWGDCSDDEA